MIGDGFHRKLALEGEKEVRERRGGRVSLGPSRPSIGPYRQVRREDREREKGGREGKREGKREGRREERGGGREAGRRSSRLKDRHDEIG